MYYGFAKNSSGYSDPTAAALAHIVHEEKVKRRRDKQRKNTKTDRREKENDRTIYSVNL